MDLFGNRAAGIRYDDALGHLPWQEFEVLLANYFREQGLDVEHCGHGGAGSPFGGAVDLRLRRGARLELVQYKHTHASAVAPASVQRLIEVAKAQGASAAIFVTTGRFSPEAERVAEQGHVQLIDGVELRRLLGERLDTLPMPKKLNAPEPLRRAQAILLKDELPRRSRIRTWRESRHAPRALLASGLVTALLVAAAVYLAPTGVSKLFPAAPATAGAPAVAPPPPADLAQDEGTVSVDVPLPPQD